LFTSKGNGLILMALIIIMLISSSTIEASISVTEGLSREFTLNPGETINAKITIKNSGEEPREVKVYLRDYFYTSEGKTSYSQPGSRIRSNADWLQLNPEQEIIIPPRGETDVHYTIQVPDDDLKGTYWCMLMIEPKDGLELFEDPEKGLLIQTGIRQISRYGIQIRTHIGDTGTEELSIIDRRLVQDQEGEKYLELDLKNVGERWFATESRLEFYDQEGFLKRKLEGPSARLYPGTSLRRRFNITDIEPGSYEVLVVFESERDKVWGALYTLTLD